MGTYKERREKIIATLNKYGKKKKREVKEVEKSS